MQNENINERKFTFGNKSDYDYLKRIFDNANIDFLSNDYELIKSNVSEQTLCGALKSRMQKYLDKDNIYDYYIDLEYNRNNGNVKTIIDDESEIVRIKCDLILHSRGRNAIQDNLLALEMKKSYRRNKEKEADKKRLIALTKSTYNGDVWYYDGETFPEHVCRYIIGIYYEADIENRQVYLEYYTEGKLTDRKVIRLPVRFIRLKNEKI